MPDLDDGESIEVQGSAKQPYVLTNTGGVYSCTCPAWRHQSLAIEQRTCKHLRKLRGEAAEAERTGSATPPRRVTKPGSDEADKPPLLLAHTWENEADLTGWWLSEKLDGVRAYWDGERFVSRLGNTYLAPAWFTAGLPKTPLDGELWGGRQMFQKTVSVVRRGDRSEHWRQLRYLVFDAPDHGGAFEERLGFVEETVREVEHAEHVEHARCEGLEHLRRELARVEGLGGEGLMLRQPGSSYVAGRSTTLLKVKTFFDAEARVVGYQDGRGRHQGRVGSLLVETPEGVRFSVGTGLSDKQREQPPAVGAIVTYRYQELTDGGVPRFPSFVGERADAEWPGEAPAKGKPAAGKPSPTRAKSTKPKAGKAKAADGKAKAAGGETKAADGKAKAADAKAAKRKPANAQASNAKAAQSKLPAGEAPLASGGARRFEFVGGSSAKFWEITVHGDQHTVRYGRIGTAGQAQTKGFADAAAAQAAADKLIAEKQKKGYVEQG